MIMNYTDYYSNLTNEAEVPFDAADTVQKGLRAKYGNDELDAYTFGIELEFFPDKSDYVSINYDEIHATLRENPRVKREYTAHVAEKRGELNKNWNGDPETWDTAYGPVDLDTFDAVVAEPELDQYSSDELFEKAHTQWSDLRQEVDRRYKRWHDYDFYDNLNDFVQTLDPEEYGIDIDNFISDEFDWHRIITETMDYIKYKMQQNVIKSQFARKDEWAVGPDGKNVEIRSKHLNQSEFHLVEKICEFVDSHGTSGGTSAHVHIGLPNDFDVFDLLAISTLVDERAVKNTAGPGRAFGEYARFRDSLHDIILKTIVARHNINEQNSYFVSNKTLFNSLAYINRNHGTNIRAMFDKQTIEFRYFDSRITSDSDLFINWIKYFLLLPKVAKSRNKIKLVGEEHDLIAARESGGVRFYTDKKAPTINLPAADIKKSKPMYASRYIPKIQI